MFEGVSIKFPASKMGGKGVVPPRLGGAIRIPAAWGAVGTITHGPGSKGSGAGTRGTRDDIGEEAGSINPDLIRNRSLP